MHIINNESLKSNSLKKVVLFILTFFICIYPPVLNYLENGTQGAASYFVADAYYYLQIADVSKDLSYYSYDGISPTNGFHPLWQYLLTFSFQFTDNQAQQIDVLFFLSIIFVSLAFAILSLVAYQYTNSFLISLIAFSPGFYYLLLSPIEFKFFSSWSFINGMESGLSLFFFAILLYLIVNRNFLKEINLTKILILALVSSLLVLSRLDDVFMLAGIISAMFLLSRYKLKNSLIYSLIISIVIIVYLIYNYSYSGMFMPVSGSSKFGFSGMNFVHSLHSIIPFAIFSPTHHHIWEHWVGETVRILQMIIPAFICILFIRNKVRILYLQKLDYNELIIMGLCVYVLIKAFYNLAFVNIWNQGDWYFPLSITIFNLILAIYLSKIEINREMKILGSSLAILFIILLSNNFANKRLSTFDLRYQTPKNQNNMYYVVWKNKDSINKMLKEKNFSGGVIEIDDGILAYILDMPVLSGTGLASSKEAFLARKSGKFLSYAYNKGYRLVSSVYYIDTKPETLANAKLLQLFINEKMTEIFHEEVKDYNFTFFAHNEKSNLIFIKVDKK